MVPYQTNSPPSSSNSVKGETMHVEGARLGDAESANEKTRTPIVDMVEIQRIKNKIDRRLPPLMAVIYLLAYLDRSNIGNAKTLEAASGDSLLQTTHMSTFQYTIALMVFLVAYSVFEIPCNLMLKLLSPSVWMPFLVTCFGILSLGLGFANNFATVTAIRFLLGMFESGVFAGLIYYCTFWYRPEDRSLRIASFLCSATLAGAFGGAIAFGVGHLNNARGLEAWRWLFVIEGLPSIVTGIVLFFTMPQYPETAKFLTPQEKEVYIAYLGNTRSIGGDAFDRKEAWKTLRNPWLYMHCLVYTLGSIGVSSLSLFTPSIVQGLGYAGLRSQLFTVIPWSVAYLCSIAGAWYADKYNRRGWTACFFFTIGSISFIVNAALPAHAFHARFAMLCFGTAGVFAALAPLCGWVSSNVGSSTAGAIANGLNITFSGPGQVIGVWIYKAKESPRYPTGHGVNAAALGVGAIMIAILTFRYQSLNKRGITVGGHAYAT